MSDGGTTGSEIGAKKAKRGIAAMKERYEDGISNRDERIAELEARLRAAEPVTVGAVAPDAPFGLPPAPAPRPPTPEPAAPAAPDVDDCLSFITPDTPYVGLVSTYSTITLRPGSARMNPQMTPVTLSYESSGVWGHCPFLIGDPTNEENDQRIKLAKNSWWFHTLPREVAEMVWDDARYRKPTRTVLDPAGYEGWDSTARTPRGTLVPIGEFVALRETVRIVLMRLRETFLDYGRRPAGFDFDPRIVNPYRNRIAGLKLADVPRGRLAREDLE